MPFPKRDVKRMPRSRKLENLAMKNGRRHAIFNTAGDKYIGEWHENKMCGKGTLLSKNKEEIYEGDFKNNFRHGFGVLVHKLAKSNVFKLSYRGYWKNGKQHGEGLRIYTDKGFFMGNWKYGKRDGYGQMWYEDGSYFEGNWLKDLRHGKESFGEYEGNN
ncbi:hypothetical protein JTB14_001848 [Gonioctena quinquepunctata]|nr:hypothetical protein JTB14_001848 [Gonioctena quinquepunctata]